jgi:hypothetical protein
MVVAQFEIGGDVSGGASRQEQSPQKGYPLVKYRSLRAPTGLAVGLRYLRSLAVELLLVCRAPNTESKEDPTFT